jgi:hypothetical protein
VACGPIQVVGREVFNIFLLGNALSVGFAAIGAKLIDWLSACAWPEAFAGGGSALIGATILLLVVRWHSKAREQPNPALEEGPLAGGAGSWPLSLMRYRAGQSSAHLAG